MWPSHQVLSQLHYLSDHRSGLPSAGPTKPAHPGQKPGQPPCLLGSSNAGPEHRQLLRPGPPGLRPQLGQGPSRLLGASSYLQTETGRSEVVAPWLQAPSPHPHSIPGSPTPLSPWLPLSFSTQLPSLPRPGQLCVDNLQTPLGDPQPHSHWPEGPLLLFTPQDPGGLESWEQPLPPAPSSPGLRQAHSHTSQFPLLLEKLQCQWPPPCWPSILLRPASLGTLTLHRNQGAWAPQGHSGHLGSQRASFWTRGPSCDSPCAEFPAHSLGWWGHNPSCGAEQTGLGQTDTGPEATAQPT